MDYRVLIISHNSFSKTHNNGKTLSAIFSGYKPDELCQLYFTAIGKPDFERCKNYYYISDNSALKSVLFRKYCGRKVVEEDDNKVTIPSPKKKNRPNNVKRYLRSAVWRFSAWYHGGLSKWVDELKPNIIFFVGGDGIFSHRIAVKLSKRLKLPLVTYFTDDYIINPPSNFYNRILKRVYKKTISHSIMLFAIGKKMADDYSTYYNREFKPIMNIVDIPPKEEWMRKNRDIISINYFGGLHLGRSEEIIRFARFMRDEVKDSLKRPYTIGVYSYAKPTEIEFDEMKDLGIHLYPGISGKLLMEAMRNSDILLHIESVNEEFHLLTKLSVSTKIPEYMCLSKPILAFGPIDVASFSVITEASSEMVVNDVDDLPLMKDQAKRLICVLNSDNELSAIAERNYCYAKEHFNKGIVSEQFKKEISSIIGKD